MELLILGILYLVARQIKLTDSDFGYSLDEVEEKRTKQNKTKMQTITIKKEGELYTFDVQNPDRLTSSEVEMICDQMRTETIFINGKIYNK